MKRTYIRLIINLNYSDSIINSIICYLKSISKYDFAWVTKALLLIIIMLLKVIASNAQTVTGSQWESASSTASSGYTNWGSGVISLTDTVTGSGSCQGSAVHETGTTYNPTSGTTFNQCFKVFFGCPANDQIGTSGNPYTDLNGDGMAFSFWKSTATYNINNGLACGGGLGYMGAVSDAKMITIEFDTYSSIGGSGFDNTYGGGAPGSGINDEISIHKDQDASDAGLITAAGTVNAGNLEDGLTHLICITYTPGTHILAVSIDGTTKISYDLGATYNLGTYFGNVGLNTTWSAGKYGANNLQTVGGSNSNIFAVMGHNPCTGAVVTPVKLLTFSGELINDEAVLNWATAVEKNNKKFIIQRSIDYSHWEVIGEVAGNGNSNSTLNYNFTDRGINDMAYYRLLQVDIDGATSISNVIVVERGAQQISISPNPFEDGINIKSSTRDEMNISIHDVLGRLLFQTTSKNENGSLTIHPDLASGAYFITIQSESFIEQQKIIKK